MSGTEAVEAAFIRWLPDSHRGDVGCWMGPR
jgi:hypothetical protein